MVKLLAVLMLLASVPAFDAPTSYGQLRTMNLRRDMRAQVGISYPVSGLQTASPNTP